MPMLKTVASGTTSVTGVQKYLLKEQRQEHQEHQREWERYAAGEIQLSERQVGRLQTYLSGASRGLAVDVSEDLPVRNWAQQMDITRAQYGHDRPTSQGASRSYYHFILSPSMDDNVALSALRAYAKAWAEENFRAGTRKHEYAIVYHDDNTKGVLHAHIVVNVSNKATGRKLHLDNDEVVALEISAQDIGKRYGLTPLREQMQTSIGARTSQPIYMDRSERELLSKGRYSWKWELRKAIADIAPLASNFDDFKLKLSGTGHDVLRSEKTGYLTYVHRNGMKVKDCRLGARFYLESLEAVFTHEQLLEDRNYSSWELIKISKGQIPWKEDIRRAIDTVAPTVMSVPELQRELRKTYGIRLIVNPRGITYQHPSGFKARDTSIGLRYTHEGLRQNAVLGMTLLYPGFEAVLNESSAFVRHYLPRSVKGVSANAHEQVASSLVFRDLSKLMVRNGLVRIEDVAPMLERRMAKLREEKAELVRQKEEVMRWNHLAVLQSRYERYRQFLQDSGDNLEPSLHNDTLIRSERLGRYLSEQAGGQDIKGRQKALNEAFEGRLSKYQEDLSTLNNDISIHQNYLMAKAVQTPSGSDSSGGSLGPQALFSAGKILSKHRIRDFFHLEQVISKNETALELAEYRLGKAEERRRDLLLVRSDIRTYLESQAYLPNSKVLAERPAALGLEVQGLRCRDASDRLAARGVDPSSFDELLALYEQADREYSELLKERDQAHAITAELKDALRVCLGVAESVRLSSDRDVEERKKSGSSSYGGMVADANTRREKQTMLRDKFPAGARQAVSELPLEEARRRRQERMRQAPERSRSRQADRYER